MKLVRLVRVGVAVVATSLVTRLAGAEVPQGPEEEVAEPRARRLESWSPEVSLGPTTFQPSLARLTFSGAGTLRGYPATFHHKGQELGLRAPRVYGGEIEVAYLRRYMALGVQVFVGHPDGPDAAPLPAGGDAPTLVSVDGLMVYGGAVDLAAAIPLGDVSVRVGPTVGVRWYAIPITAYDLTTCRSKSGSYPCPEQGWSEAQPFLAPRLRVDWTPARAGFFVGGYVAVNMFDVPTVGGGIVVGAHWAHADLRP